MADIIVETGADPVENGANLQAAIEEAEFGDNIIVEAGAEYWTTDAPFYAPFNLGPKTGGTGTDADFITIKSDALASLPEGVRVVIADAVYMAKIVSRGPGGAFLYLEDATYWKLAGLEICNVSDGTSPQHTNTFVNLGASGTDHIWIDRCYIHPQEDGTSELGRTASHGIVVSSPDGGPVIHDIRITNNRLSGLGGTYAHDLGQVIDAIAISTNVLDTILVDNNFLGGGYQPWFPAGADIVNAGIGVVQASPAATLTSATLSTVSGLSVGDYISFDQPPGHHQYATAVVESISGNDITFTSLFRITDDPEIPAVGDNCYWKGAVGINYTITNNTFDIDEELAAAVYAATSSNPKGTMEWKMGENVLIEGNIFQGRPTSFAINAVNQTSATPWTTVRNFMLRNNWFKNFSVAFNMQLGNPVPPDNTAMQNEMAENITIENNLLTQNNTLEGDLGVTKIALIGSGENINFIHNTFAMNPAYDGNVVSMYRPIQDMTFRDNIFYYSRYGFICNTGTPPLGDCVPGFSETNNVIINELQIITDSEILDIFPSSFVATEDEDVMWTGMTYDNIEHWRLAVGSPYRAGQAMDASDNTDVGVDIDALIAALGDVPPPASQRRTKKGKVIRGRH